MKIIRICVLWFVGIVILVGCTSTNDQDLMVNIQNKDLNKNENILIKSTDEKNFGFKPEYSIEISLESPFTSQFEILGEQLEYLKTTKNEAKFDMIIDVDSTRDKEFRLMIWNGETFTSIKESEQVEKYYDINLPEGKNHLVLDNYLVSIEDSQTTELAFLVHDRDFPADIDYIDSPIRMYVSDKEDLLDVSLYNDKKYKIDESFLQKKVGLNESETPQLSFLDKNKDVLKVKQLTDETEYLSINQIAYDINESIIFYDIHGYIYESYFMIHPGDQQVVVPIPSKIKDNIGKKDYFVLINNNFGQVGINEIQKVIKDGTVPYVNYSFFYKIGSENK